MEGSRFCNGSRPCRNVGHVGTMRSERPWGGSGTHQRMLRGVRYKEGLLSLPWTGVISDS